MLTSETSPVYSNLQPRHASRRVRTPGARERHSSQRERMSPEPRPRPATRPHTAQPKPSYCMQTGVAYSAPRTTSKPYPEPEITSSSYKELSTIEEIRAAMRSTEKRKPGSIPAHVPHWMMDLDINLDLSSADIIPPFDDKASGEKETFHEKATVTIVYDDDESEDDVDSLPSDETFPEFEHSRRLDKLNDSREFYVKDSGKSGHRDTKGSTYTADTIPLRRTMSSLSQRSSGENIHFNQTTSSPGGNMSTMVIRGRDNASPCRYQGDMKVMSMQRGGIRSTPMQPKSKKFINQMLTYRQMKIHSTKMKAVKPAVDTRMPESFKLALERKKLVEHRHSSSLDQSYDTSSRSSPSPRTSRSNVKVR